MRPRKAITTKAAMVQILIPAGALSVIMLKKAWAIRPGASCQALRKMITEQKSTAHRMGRKRIMATITRQAGNAGTLAGGDAPFWGLEPLLLPLLPLMRA